jgi:hypothetical protein
VGVSSREVSTVAFVVRRERKSRIENVRKIGGAPIADGGSDADVPCLK